MGSRISGPLKNQNGSVVLYIVVVISVLLMSSIAYIGQTSLRATLESLRAVNVGSAGAYKSSVMNLILSQQAFIKSARATANIPFWSCLNDPEFDCQVAGEQAFFLFSDDQDPNVDTAFVDMTADQGLTERFNHCPAGATFPSTGCPYRYELKWHTACVSGPSPCNSPSIFIQGRLRLAGISLLKLYVISRDFDIDLQIR